MKITARGLNRATLARQLLLGREPLGVAEGARRVVALQAQAAASPYLALWNRLDRFDPADLDAAFAHQTLLKATLMRVTLHAVHGDDYKLFREAMDPTLRSARLNDRRFRNTGLMPEDADAMIPALLRHARRPRTGADFRAWCEDQLGEKGEWVWWALRHYAPLVHEPSGGPWAFGPRPSYVAAPRSPTLSDRDAADEALRHLVLRYLEGFGPASVEDMAQFGLVQRGRLRPVVVGLDDELERLVGPNGEELYDVPGSPRPSGRTSAPVRLMAMWDSTLLAYHDRSRVIPPDYRKVVIRSNGDVLPTLLVDGYVAGVWRPVEEGIEVLAFGDLTKRAWQQVEAEAASLGALLAERELQPYSRYHRWWNKLPGGEVRMVTR